MAGADERRVRAERIEEPRGACLLRAHEEEHLVLRRDWCDCFGRRLVTVGAPADVFVLQRSRLIELEPETLNERVHVSVAVA